MDSFGSLRALARQHREQYDADSMANAEQFDSPEASNMFQPSVMTGIQNGHAAAQADYAPEWDAWFEALNQAGGGKMPQMKAAQSGPFSQPRPSALGSLRKLKGR